MQTAPDRPISSRSNNTHAGAYLIFKYVILSERSKSKSLP